MLSLWELGLEPLLVLWLVLLRVLLREPLRARVQGLLLAHGLVLERVLWRELVLAL
jgi:hypothetical protein